jgi:hypothetical protein
VIVRGNHEVCQKKESGYGFYYLFGYQSYRNTPNCSKKSNEQFDEEKYSNPYDINLNKKKFIIFDSSSANDHPNTDEDKFVEPIRKFLELSNDKESFLITHKPIYVRFF